eukprot:CAMPEP_0117579990 /NCGR_PEP_ID=MMETSP0784-20121206/64939_1 /TAXON_ID=39447 /ORGANISM="" /LENGTH=147 /DNA_ID=CAMNT_0005379973 /DNA_START=85 /DNA_END=528 /DNA_ORIENTATION=+
MAFLDGQPCNVVRMQQLRQSICQRLCLPVAIHKVGAHDEVSVSKLTRIFDLPPVHVLYGAKLIGSGCAEHLHGLSVPVGEGDLGGWPQLRQRSPHESMRASAELHDPAALHLEEALDRGAHEQDPGRPDLRGSSAVVHPVRGDGDAR